MACKRRGCEKASFKLVPFAGYCSPKCKIAHESEGDSISGPVSCKLTPTQVEFIKRELSRGTVASRLAEAFEVTDSTISSIRYNRIWAHVVI